jgi:cyclic lactone autoinducer peptide
MKVRILSAAATLFTIIAALVASSACAWGNYQPEEPLP